MYAIGIDAGSVATKGVIFNGEVAGQLTIPTGWSPRAAAESVLAALWREIGIGRDDTYIVATGYGRVSLPFADKTVTEITCHARGAFYLDAAVRTVIDIGGQDSKVIRLDEGGQVCDFAMNDKCAAGTGRFLQVMLNLLGEDISQLDRLAGGAEPERINSMCTVFAESEVVSLLACGSARERIAAGIVESIAGRTAALAGKVAALETILFTGGLAQSASLRGAVQRAVGKPVQTHPLAQLTGAVGAAVIGWKEVTT